MFRLTATHQTAPGARFTRSRAVLLVSAAAVVLAATGCTPAGSIVLPNPTSTATPTPDIVTRPTDPTIDPRCLREFPDDAAIVQLSEVPVRPTFWPAPPEFAALCWWETPSEFETIGYYATDEFMTQNQIFSYYEQQFNSPDREVVHGRSPTADDEVLHGVYPPVSFFIEMQGRHGYKIHWAHDGEYEAGND